MRVSRSLCAFVAAAGLAGCAADSPTSPASHPPVDLSSVIAQATAGGMNGISTAALMGAPTSISAPPVTPSACAYSAAIQGFVCPTTTSGQLTFDITYYLYDAAGHAQSQFDANTTSAIRTVTDAKGTIAAPGLGSGLTIGIVDHGDNTLTGLLTATRTLNGTETSHFDATTTGTTNTHILEDASSATSNVVLSTDTSAPWPKAGTIASTMKTTTTAGSIGPVTTTMQMLITFNGTSTPTITITIGGLTTTCRVDLTGKTPSACT